MKTIAVTKRQLFLNAKHSALLLIKFTNDCAFIMKCNAITTLPYRIKEISRYEIIKLNYLFDKLLLVYYKDIQNKILLANDIYSGNIKQFHQDNSIYLMFEAKGFKSIETKF